MATIEKRNGKYRARVRLNGHQHSKTFDYKADAVAWASKIETSIVERTLGKTPSDMTFGDLINKYLNEVTPQKRGARNESYRLKRVLSYPLAGVLLKELRSEHFAIWRDTRLKEVSSASVRRELSSLGSICQYAVREWNLIPLNYVHQISKPKASKPRSYIPSDEEIDEICALLGYVEGVPIMTTSQRVALALRFAVETAMRAGEICNMEWQDVHLHRRVVHLPMTKNGSSRDVPLSKRAMEILNLLPREEGKSSVFGLNVSSLDVLFRKARDKTSYSDFHFHDTRHKALTRMAGKIEPMQLAKISGHKDLKILLNTYYNPDIGSLADLLD